MSANTSEGVTSGVTSQSAINKPLHQFTEKLFAALTSGPNKSAENIIVSPISIHKALNLVLLGTDANSATKQELQDAIGYAGLSETEIQKCHEDYARALAKFREITSETLEEIKQHVERSKEADENNTLFMGSSPRTPVMEMFNMMITKDRGEVKPKYEADIKKYYESTIENVDDKNSETKKKLTWQLNSWAKEAGFDSPIMTEGELNQQFAAILISAIRVHAFWFDDFYESNLASEVFFNHGLKENRVNVTMLNKKELSRAKYLEFTDDESRSRVKHLNQHLQEESFKELSKLNFQVVEVPLLGGLSFTIFEPLEHSTPDDNKLNKLITALLTKSTHAGDDSANLSTVYELLGQHGRNAGRLDLSMPKFKFEKELGLVDTLKSMGLQRVFDEASAQISEMMSEKVYISDVKHQAVIDVNKKGIKAAGVTKVTAKLCSLSLSHSRPIRVAIEKPFMFVISFDEIPLFVGQLTRL